VGMKTKLNAVQ